MNYLNVILEKICSWKSNSANIEKFELLAKGLEKKIVFLHKEILSLEDSDVKTKKQLELLRIRKRYTSVCRSILIANAKTLPKDFINYQLSEFSYTQQKLTHRILLLEAIL